MQTLAPPGFEICWSIANRRTRWCWRGLRPGPRPLTSDLCSAPVFLHDVVRLAIVVVTEQREHFMSRPSFIKRSNQRLHDRHGAVVRARVTPRFKVMRGRNVPMTNLRRFVVVEIQMGTQLDSVQPIIIKPEVGGRVVSWIAADNDQCVYCISINVVDQLAQRLSLIDRIGFNWICIEDALANVAKLYVNAMRQCMNFRRLFVSCYDD